MPDETYVHPSAIVEEGAELGRGVHVGPFCHISSEAVIGDDVELIGHVTIMGATTLGAGSQVYPNAVLGGAPQNLKHRGGPSTLTIGKRCIIRESATVHRGTDTSRGETTVGDDCYLMAYTHVGHDCVVGNHVTMSNYAALSGHSEIGNYVILSGFAAVHQFVRVGHHAFLGGFAAVVGDVIPYGMAVGDRAKLRGLNVVGIKRSGLSRSELMQLRQAYRLLFAPERPISENIEVVRQEFPDSPQVADILDFLAGRDKRHLTVPPRGGGVDDGDDGAE